MKKFALMALSLIIVMMGVSLNEVMGQSRRSANPASSSTSVQKSSSANRDANVGGSRRSGSSSNMNAANAGASSRSAATRTPATGGRSTNISRETAAHAGAAARTGSSTNAVRSNNSTRNTAAANAARTVNPASNTTRNAAGAVTSRSTSTRNTAPATSGRSTSTRNIAANTAKPVDNAARNVASNAARHDNVAPKAGTRTEAPRVNDNAPAARNNAPMAEERMHNNPPRPHDNPPMVHHGPAPARHHGHNPPPPPRPRPPKGSHFRAAMIGTLITIAKINAINNAIRRAEIAARLATRYSVVINRNYVPRTYATIVETVRDDIDYYYRDGVFYVIGANGDYYVIEPPIGALVEAIPADYERVVIDGEIYYQVDDTLYRVTIIDGTPWFEVVVNL